MRQKSVLVVLVVALISCVVFPTVAVAAQNPAPVSLEEQLRAQYQLARLDASQKQVLERGSILVIQKEGVFAVAPNLAVCASTYENGNLHAPSGPCVDTAKGSSRNFPVGERVYPTGLTIDLKQGSIALAVSSLETFYKALVAFQFPPGYLERASVLEVEDRIGEVLAIYTPPTEAAPTEQPAAVGAAPGQALTNDDIVKLVQVKLGDSLIITKIKSSSCSFDTSTDALIKLKATGVSDAVLQAMVEAGGQPMAAASTTGQPVIVSEDTLLSRGFSFYDQPRAMCSIKGPEGPCQVEAFVFGESREDRTGGTCSKLDRGSYFGHCVDGALQGFCVVVADGTTKLTRAAYVSYFDKGRMAYPALMSWLDANQPKFFGVTEKSVSYGCVLFGRWDNSRTRGSCPRFMDIYGSDIFTESNVQALREGSFDLSHYGAKFVGYVLGK